MNSREQEQDSPSRITMHMKCLLRSVMQRVYIMIRSVNGIRLVDRAMAADFSWNNSARQYEEMYNWLIGE